MNKKFKKILKYSVLYPVVVLRRKHDHYLSVHNPEKWWSVMHHRFTGHYLDIEHPHNLNEKIQYMSFHTDTSEWSRLTDKVAVREYLKEKGYPNLAPQLFSVYRNSSEIDYDKLPNQFVIKTNNGCATNIIVRDKSKLDVVNTNTKLDAWLKVDYGIVTCQPHYSRIRPLILAEEFLVDNNHPGEALRDYKFYCVNGTPFCVYVYEDRKDNSHDMKRMVYDMQWNEHPEYLGKCAIACHNCKKPDCFDEMIEIATVLSSPFKFVRVDLYDVNGKPVFGELTFTPGLQESSMLLLNQLGEMIIIDQINDRE